MAEASNHALFLVFQTCHACIGVVLTERNVNCITLNCWDVTSILLQDVSIGNNMAVVLLRTVSVRRNTTSVHCKDQMHVRFLSSNNSTVFD